MKVLLFTHEQDIDGLGCASLAETAKIEYKLVLSKTFELDEKISMVLDKEDISSYDKIIVTDLCPKEETLKMIAQNETLSKKFKVLDHHKTAEEFNCFDFVTVVSEEASIKESGTSLFYKYLKDNNLITGSDVLDEFVELTRQYDTWDWYKNKNYLARKLHIIFETQGIAFYLSMINRIITSSNKVALNKEEEKIVAEFDRRLLEEINKMLDFMIVETLNIKDTKFRVGYIKSLYKYRNDIADVLKDNNKNDIDAIGMIMEDRDSVSYRSIKDVDVSVIAEYFGGSGLCITALNGFPGVMTHRFLGEDATDEERNEYLIKEVDKQEDRSAQVVCNLVFYDGKEYIIGEGIIEGQISRNRRGENGFGFDEIFELSNGKTLAELTPEEKNEVSARALAAKQLKKKLELR